jgi:MFS family permease
MDAVLADKASGLYFGSFSLGVILAPVTGSLVYDDIFGKNWESTCDIFGIAAAVYTVTFLVFNVLPDIGREARQN